MSPSDRVIEKCPPAFVFNSRRRGDRYWPVWGNTRDPVQQWGHKTRRHHDDQVEICKSQKKVNGFKAVNFV